MDERDEKLMAEYGITAEEKVVYHYHGHRYDRLSDAVNYAKIQQSLERGGAKWDQATVIAPETEDAPDPRAK